MLDTLVRKLRAAFPDQRFEINSSPTPSVVFPAVHPEVGPVEVHAERGELTVYLPRFTHTHFENFDRGLSEDEAANQMADEVVAFLAQLFKDQIILWGTSHGGGGWYARDNKQSFISRWLKGKRYVWSGPLPSDG